MKPKGALIPSVCSPDRLIPLDVLVSWSINALGAILGAIGEQYISTKGLPGPDFAVFTARQ